MQTPIPCTVMRGGTSKGLYFLAKDLPTDSNTRNRVLLAAMGSPDERQIDGLGGAHPLTSKVAIVSPSKHPGADVDYLFLQIKVDCGEVSDSQNCGNLLAGVGPFAIEQGLVNGNDGTTPVRIQMLNTNNIAVANVNTPKGKVNYDGELAIDGVPGTAAAIALDFLDVAGSSCGELLPTGNLVDLIDGVEVSCIDNGMPVVLLSASDFNLSGYESPAVLESNQLLIRKIESIRLKAGKLMNLGDVEKLTVPKMSLLAKAERGGVIATRTFIPHRVHDAIGVLGAVSVATGCVINGSVAQRVAGIELAAGTHALQVEHPTGSFAVEIEFEGEGVDIHVKRSALLRTARKLMAGQVFIPANVWGGQ